MSLKLMTVQEDIDELQPALLTPGAAAKYLSMSPQKLRDLARDGTLRRRKEGGRYVYLRAELDEYVERLEQA